MVRGAQDRSTLSKNAGDGVRRQAPPSIWFDEAAKPVLKTNRFNPLIGRGLNDRADRRVQPGGVAAAGEDSDAHR